MLPIKYTHLHVINCASYALEHQIVVQVKQMTQGGKQSKVLWE